MTLRDRNEPFFYEDMNTDDLPVVPDLRHPDDLPEPFFRDRGAAYYLNSEGQIVDSDGKPTYFFQHLADKTRPPFTDPMDAACSLMLDDCAFFMCRAYLDFDWRAYVATVRSTVR